MADDQTGLGFEDGPDDARVGRAVALHAGEGLHHAAALHFMVVLADQVFLAANVQAAEHGLEEFRLIHSAVFDAGVGMHGRFPYGVELVLGHAVVHEFHVQMGHELAVVGHMEDAVVGEFAERGSFHIHALGKGEEFVERRRRHGEGHALLRFGKQDFPRAQAVVFEGRAGQIDAAAVGVFRHFADGGGQAARAVVGNGVVQAEIPGAHDEVVHLALGDRVADLYGGGGRAFVQLFRREGRAVDAVLADTAAGHDDDVADLRFLLIALARLAVRGGLAGGHFGGDQADGAAIDQRLAEVALVEHDGAVDGGDAGLVAAVFHAFAHAFEDAAGM